MGRSASGIVRKGPNMMDGPVNRKRETQDVPKRAKPGVSAAPDMKKKGKERKVAPIRKVPEKSPVEPHWWNGPKYRT
jgi:hypothetical protein